MEALRTKRPEDAIRAFEAALKYRPLLWSYDTLETCLADALAELGRNPEAIKAYERVLEVTPRHPLAVYRLAVALERQSRTKEARKRLAELVALWGDADVDVPELVDARKRLSTKPAS